MKTNLIIVLFASLFTCLSYSSASSDSDFASQISLLFPETQQGGITQKSSEVYEIARRFVDSGLQNDPDIQILKADGSVIGRDEILNSFRYSCADQDLSDSFQWSRYEESKVRLTFDCTFYSDDTKLTHKTFIISLSLPPTDSRFEVEAILNNEVDSQHIQKIKVGGNSLARSILVIATSAYLSRALVNQTMAGQGSDKGRHAYYSNILSGAIAASLHYFLGWSPEKSVLAGVTLSFSIGFAKEVATGLFTKSRRTKYGTGEWADVKANTPGVIIGGLGMYINLKFQ